MNRNIVNYGNGRDAFDLFFQDVSDMFSGNFKRGFINDVRLQTSGKVDMRENEKEYIVEVDLPGFTEEEIEISIKDEVLTLSCKKNIENTSEKNDERKTEEKKDIYIIKERSQMQFKRSFSFSANIDEEEIIALFENGVLEVRIPKKEEKKSRQIMVNCKKQLQAN